MTYRHDEGCEQRERERDALRAEVAALREAEKADRKQWLKLLQEKDRDLAEARALLAEGLLCCGCVRESRCSFCTTTRAFLARGRDEGPRECECERWEAFGHFRDCKRHPANARAEARRCTCSYGWNGPGPHSDGCEWEPRDEAPRCTCGSPIDGLHDVGCGLGPARDEGER